MGDMKDKADKAMANFFSLVDQIVPDVLETVQRIEAKPLKTRDHYEEYLKCIPILSQGNHCMATVVALAMVKAGGNRQGIMSAMACLYPTHRLELHNCNTSH